MSLAYLALARVLFAALAAASGLVVLSRIVS